MSSAKIIDGKEAAARLKLSVATAVSQLKQKHGIVPGLATVLVGDDPASQVYVKSKQKAAIDAGMHSYQRDLPMETSEADLLTMIAELNADPAVNGILVQLPVPQQIDSFKIITAISSLKDVDGLNPKSVGCLVAGGGDALVSCTPLGCLMLLKDALGDLTGKRALIMGRSNLVGKPMAHLLLQENCTVTVAHSRTVDLPGLCRTADVVIAAMGQAEMVRGDWIKPGATVIDVGIIRVPAGKGKTRLVGDVNYHEAVKVAGNITPVPGGVGPMTIACLMLNTLRACCTQKDITDVSLPLNL
ncbi:MAG TPA: bifunctional methylenetetrahydrofolate dehydrogenase/methenyltetrahydrofolate cyclohydrolase [Rhodospirillaceae bacterium]|nr:bifunctional methylenetetrahydrofolate dehydrogenase/methenyltetrahydrofolate cyclohydrolase [Rhodospirillaceae bacterium]